MMGDDRTGSHHHLGPVTGAGRCSEADPHLPTPSPWTGALVFWGLRFLLCKVRMKITALPASGGGGAVEKTAPHVQQAS